MFDVVAEARPDGHGSPTPASSRRAGSVDAAVILAAIALLAVVVAWWGSRQAVADPRARLGAAPFAGGWAPLWSWRVLAVIGVAVGLVLIVRRLSAKASWSVLLVGAAGVAVGYSVGLAWTEGEAGLLGSLDTRFDYLAVLPELGSPAEFLRSFVDRVPTLPIHVQSHPPGMVLLLHGLDGLGLGGPAWAAVVVIIGGAAAVPAVLVAVADVAGQHTARRVAPFLALAPAAVWTATSADALFAGVGAWAVALLVRASNPGARRVESTTAGLAGGVLAAVALSLSYGALLLLVLPAVVAAGRQRFRPLLLAGGVVVVAYLGLRLAGFDWWTGLAATRLAYAGGVSHLRPYGYFLVANLVVLVAMIGPATVVALGRLRQPRIWWLCGATLTVLLAADLSGLAKGEVERIWLPFAPWLVVATAALSHPQRWLVGNVAVGLSLQCFLRSPW